MTIIAQKFADLRQNKKKAFIPYIMAGDPGLDRTVQLIELLAANGADLIEVGVPFSDPVADGPVIQQAGVRSLQNGCTFDKILASIKKVTPYIDTPLILMMYYNMIFQKGFQKFFESVKIAGCTGLIIPDLPPDEAAELRPLAEEYQIGLNFLVAPTSSDERIRLAAEASTGFLYAVSLKGVTGMRSSLPPELPQFVSKIKSLTDKPVAVGFGIATAEQAKMVAGLADGVIVGSAIVKAAASDPELSEVKRLVRELRGAIG
ncbi:MAG TPA: tryptophan synthase subunit alpha [Firmicutes bacterium]|jgi:tryptophan synthase alpha chain|nr:tryptophan synthase subunit alpha [Bacillota bacterium]